MIQLLRTDAKNPDFVNLVKLLDEALQIYDGKDHAFYHQFNGIESIPYVVVAYVNGLPVGCGAVKPFGADAMEVKRMFVLPEWRGKGIAAQVLSELEKWATGLGISRCILETGKRQTEALHLYPKNGYVIIPNYGQYTGVENSVCFEKKLA